jgi:broad specificity phosphatase PhoE
MELTFVRHGETQHNKEHRLMGQRIDDDLNEQGLHQAEDLIKKLPKNVEVIFSSPLKRARQTAEIISKHLNKPVKISELLTERDFGSLSGKSWEEINDFVGKDLHAIDQSLHYDYGSFGGESISHVKSRLIKFIDELVHKHKIKRAIVVTHYGLIMIMDSLFPSKDKESLGNVSVHRYKIKY